MTADTPGTPIRGLLPKRDHYLEWIRGQEGEIKRKIARLQQELGLESTKLQVMELARVNYERIERGARPPAPPAPTVRFDMTPRGAGGRGRGPVEGADALARLGRPSAFSRSVDPLGAFPPLGERHPMFLAPGEPDVLAVMAASRAAGKAAEAMAGEAPGPHRQRAVAEALAARHGLDPELAAVLDETGLLSGEHRPLVGTALQLIQGERRMIADVEAGQAQAGASGGGDGDMGLPVPAVWPLPGEGPDKA